MKKEAELDDKQKGECGEDLKKEYTNKYLCVYRKQHNRNRWSQCVADWVLNVGQDVLMCVMVKPNGESLLPYAAMEKQPLWPYNWALPHSYLVRDYKEQCWG